MQNLLDSQQAQLRLALIKSGEELLAAIGIDPVLKRGPLKVTDATLRRAAKLQKEVYDRCKTFLQEPKFERIKLELPDIDFLELQPLLTNANNSEWLASKIQDLVHPDMMLNYSIALKNALNYLNSILPKLPVSITSKKTRPSDFELARFNRAYRTVNDPLTILSDMEMGCLSRAQVQTLMQVYPHLYELIKQCLIEAAVELTAKDEEFNPTYAKLQQVSVLMLSSVVPQDLQSLLQNNFAKQGPEAASHGSNAGGNTQAVQMAQQTYSPMQKAEMSE